MAPTLLSWKPAKGCFRKQAMELKSLMIFRWKLELCLVIWSLLNCNKSNKCWKPSCQMISIISIKMTHLECSWKTVISTLQSTLMWFSLQINQQNNRNLLQNNRKNKKANLLKSLLIPHHLKRKKTKSHKRSQNKRKEEQDGWET